MGYYGNGFQSKEVTLLRLCSVTLLRLPLSSLALVLLSGRTSTMLSNLTSTSLNKRIVKEVLGICALEMQGLDRTFD